MKNIILLLIILTIYYSNSQDYYPTVPFTYNVQGYGNIQINANTAPYKQTEFIRGWQWGSHPELSEAMHCNQANISDVNIFNTNYLNRYTNTYVNLSTFVLDGSGNPQNYFYSHLRLDELFNNTSFEYKAGLLIGETNNEDSLRFNPAKLYTINGDIDNPVFGFRYIHPNLLNSQGNQVNPTNLLNSGGRKFFEITKKFRL